MAGVKLQDNLKDDGRVRDRLAWCWYKRSALQAMADLSELGVDVIRLEWILQQQQQIESAPCVAPLRAAGPTAEAYGMAAEAIAQNGDESRVLGTFLGECVYLLDALRDMGRDKKECTFNPFVSRGSNLRETRQTATDFMRSHMKLRRVALQKRLATASATLRERWDLTMDGLAGNLAAQTSGRLNMCCVIPCGDGLCCISESKKTSMKKAEKGNCGPCCCACCCLLLICPGFWKGCCGGMTS